VVFVAAVARNIVSGVSADTELARRLARGDMAAVEALYARFGKALFAYVRSLGPDDGMAEEIVQDTFVAAWRGAARFEGRSTLSSWLFGIARRQARDRMRGTVPAFEPAEVLESAPDPDLGPEAQALAAASRDAIRRAIARIPDADREVLLLTFAHDLSGPEVAEVLGIPAGTVKSRLFHARRRLREQLSEEDAI
jgi:RNA polymerase sigma-70 factor (ECF subfamily)